jgi:hypothetical protein
MEPKKTKPNQITKNNNMKFCSQPTREGWLGYLLIHELWVISVFLSNIYIYKTQSKHYEKIMSDNATRLSSSSLVLSNIF